MKRFLLCGVAALSLAAVAAPALANQYAYVAQNDPWYNQTNDAAMNGAFGAGNWDRLTSYSNAMFSGGYSFIFVDGGNDNSNFSSWLSSGGTAAAEAYVTGGGALLLDAAPNYSTGPMQTGFGSQINYPGFSNDITVNLAGIAAGLSNFGAGTVYTGSAFAHSNVTGGGLTSLIDGEGGVVFAEGYFGAGHLSVSGETTTNFRYGPDANQLRINELVHAAGGAGAVPEPASWALMMVGFGGLGVALRRRRAVAIAA